MLAEDRTVYTLTRVFLKDKSTCVLLWLFSKFSSWCKSRLKLFILNICACFFLKQKCRHSYRFHRFWFQRLRILEVEKHKTSVEQKLSSFRNKYHFMNILAEQIHWLHYMVYHNRSNHRLQSLWRTRK